MTRPPSALVSVGSTPYADEAASLAVVFAARFSTLLEKAISPSTRSRQRSVPTAEVGRALILFPAGRSGASRSLVTSVPHTSPGTAYSCVADDEEHEVAGPTSSATPRRKTAERVPPLKRLCISPS
ncbi:hypothetical protein [Streptomyces collinus]|uniref:hypothetical protein n=1 Tax=Streptomyces collinus TaxID=42684 RepID=UPI0036EB1CF9